MRLFYKKIVVIIAMVFVVFCLQSCKTSAMEKYKNVDWKCDKFDIYLPYESLKQGMYSTIEFEGKIYKCYVGSYYKISITLCNDNEIIKLDDCSRFLETNNYTIEKVKNKEYQYYIEVEVIDGYVYKNNLLADCNNIIHFYGYER